MKRWGNYLLSVVSVVITLLVIEIGFRIAAYYTEVKTLASLQAESPADLQGQEVSLGRMIRLNPNPRIIYELIPNLSVRFKDQPLSINASGFRGQEIPIEKNVRTLRIVGIGDSIMFGWGVQEHETYLALLTQKLNANAQGFVWEAINTGVPGYNTWMEVETLKQKGVRYQPDIVILNYVGNDTNLPNFITTERENYFALNQSFLVKYFSHKKFRSFHLMRARERRFENNDPSQVPQRYRWMVGEDGVRAALEELAALRQKYQFEVIMLSHTEHPEWIREISQTFQFHIVEIAPEWRNYAKEHNLTDPESSWRLKKDDPHPSALGHQVICDTLVKYLDESGLAQNVMGRQRKGK